MKIKLLTLLLILISLTTISAQTTNAQLRLQIMQNIASDQMEAKNKYYPQIASYITNFNTTTKKWIDFNYVVTNTNFGVVKHLDRMEVLAAAYVDNTSNYYQDSTMLSILFKAIEHWASVNYVNQTNNWFPKKIRVPISIGKTFIPLEANNITIPSSARSTIMNRHMVVRNVNAYGGPGSNSVDIGLANIFTNILRNEPSSMVSQINTALNTVSDPTCGIRSDYSFQAHGNMLNTYSYGAVFLNKIFYIVTISGTNFQLTNNQKNILKNWLIKGFYTGFRSKYRDYQLFGRSITRKGSILGGGGKAEDYLNYVDPTHAADHALLKEVITGTRPANETPIVGYSDYWQADYITQARAEYHFTSAMVSTRNKTIENILQENKKGNLISCGAYSIRVDGNEYHKILPLWNWNKLPGVTSFSGHSPSTGGFNSNGYTSFVGGVSNGTVGAYAYNHARYGVKAKKGLFSFKDYIICLGSDIQPPNTTETVHTVINQTFFKNSYVAQVNGTQNTVSASGKTTYGQNLDWVYHHKVGYIPLMNSDISINIEKNKTKKWSVVGNEPTNAEVTGDLVTIQVNHGKKSTSNANVVNKKYAYALYPGRTITEVSTFDTSKLKIINTDSIQAVKNTEDKLLQIIFYKAATYNDADGITITADRGCVILVKNYDSVAAIPYYASPDRYNRGVNVSFTLPLSTGKIQKTLTFQKPNYGQTNTVVGDFSYSSQTNLNFEAETATLTGTAQIANCTNTSGGKMVKAIDNGSTNGLSFGSIDIPSTGLYKLDIAYYSSGSRNLTFQINGGSPQTIAISGTGQWCYQGGSPGNHYLQISLNTGINTILFYDSPIIDKITITEIVDGGIFEAENATLTGAALIFSCAQSSGGKSVKNLTGGSANAVTFNITAANTSNYELKLSYMSASNTTVEVEINGVLATLNAPSSGNWCYEGGSPTQLVTSVSLTSGNNSIKVYNSPQLDKIKITASNTTLSQKFNSKTAVTPNSKPLVYPTNIYNGENLNIEIDNKLFEITKYSSLIIFDFLGRTAIPQQTIRSSKSEIPIKGMNSGVYILEIKIDEQKFVRHFIIK